MAAAAPRSSGQRPRHLTPREKDVSRELPTKPPMNPVTGGTNQQAPPPPKTSPTSQKTSSKTPDQGSPVLQAGDFPPLTDAGALRRPTKKTATQNAQLLVKIAALEAGSSSATPASPLTNITAAAPDPTPMCTTPSVSEPSNTEERFQAIESTMTALMTQLTTVSKSIETLSNTVTQQVTSNIKTWLHGTNPRSRRASPLKDVNRPSKFSHAIDLAEISEDSELLLAQGTDVGVESLPATPNSQYGDTT
ncbi:hypothetical protein MTO96_034964 [Rhipicephalus appendiculatus]